jgi:hypothetical protein
MRICNRPHYCILEELSTKQKQNVLYFISECIHELEKMQMKPVVKALCYKLEGHGFKT